jgi:hypothetical protein
VDRRLKLPLPDPLVGVLEQIADETGEPVARVAARLLREQIEHPPGRPASSSAMRRSRAERRHGERAPWLEPYGGDREWRRRMWAEIVALHGRYPHLLSQLQDGWWNDTAHVEQLCALVHWRGQLDDAASDPVEEWTFQMYLAEYARVLTQEPGGVSNAWVPGAPPDDWT